MSRLITIDIVGHADFGGRLRSSKLHPGYVRFASAIDKLREQNPEGFLLLDAGDEFTADYWGGRPVVDALALMKTDAFTLGNHEFDNGQDFLEDCISYAPFPVLCANIQEKATGELIKGCKPWVILEKAGLKIGILGLTTEYTPYMVTAPQFTPFEVTSAVEAAKKQIPIMREMGADLLVVVAHFPFYADENGNISGELHDVLVSIPPVDVFVGGHIPGNYGDVYCDTAVLKGGFGQASIPHARLWYDIERKRVVRKEVKVHLTALDAVEEEPYKSFAKEHTAPFDDYLGSAE